LRQVVDDNVRGAVAGSSKRIRRSPVANGAPMLGFDAGLGQYPHPRRGEVHVQEDPRVESTGTSCSSRRQAANARAWRMSSGDDQSPRLVGGPRRHCDQVWVVPQLLGLDVIDAVLPEVRAALSDIAGSREGSVQFGGDLSGRRVDSLVESILELLYR
jgi:hypothetical protein